MPRRKSVNFVRYIAPDARYGSETVQKLINVMMFGGKKNAARTVVYDALDILVKKAGGDKEKGLSLFIKALDQIIPSIEVRPRRVGGSVYQIPVEVPHKRGRALALRWLIAAAKPRPDKTMGIRLAHELIEASEGRGTAVKRRMDVYKMAEANRAFSHYAW
ncbi:30S ribosomal protein S7 [Candidatus Dependentiae bacterium]|nr:30S ribosomal protein S7 [Candidatus Dependentiae bacterium]